MTLSVSISSNLDQFALEVDFQAPRGVTAIFGASGSGKTTIINAIAGLHRPDRGQISFDDDVFFSSDKEVDLPVSKRRLGYVFQDHRLFPHMTVVANLKFARRARKLGRQDGQFDRIIDLLGLSNVLERYPVDLSGGEKQRVAIGRALLSDPKVLLLDEPLASLDQTRRLEILPYLERLRDTTQLPILYVSHSVSEVARLANHVVLLDRGQQGKTGTVSEVFSDPQSAQYVAQSDLGAVLFARFVKVHDDGVSELMTSGGGRLFVNQQLPKSDHKVRVRIKAQDVMLSLSQPEGISALNSLQGHISDIQSSATGGVLVQIECGEDFILSRITERSRRQLCLEVGQEIFAILKTVSMAQNDIGYRNN
ncbi:molybdenum ABC transporter ATP-binding protein [Cognatishimia activa]|uniref:molybdenum ABC transporter ATP-binding protein n=1 Tax=Cognatishimia activa TaxID=1715691 RepID=UPI0022313EC2|nr:molybdenum ABC transporter ATP-binding protein [Cognatishimia activa]UZD91543.1 molybdenum ABC transporter ATP-binding protein [Cognatishimia activa]